MEFSSDCESIRTEDFASKFCEYVPADTCKDSGYSYDKSERCLTPVNRDDKYTENRPSKIESRFSTSKQMYNQTLDLDSIATEMFDDQLHNFQDPHGFSERSAPSDSCNTSLHLGNLSNVQPMRRDIMNKFLSKYSSNDARLSTENKSSSIECPKVKLRISNENEKSQISKKEVNWKTEGNKIPSIQLHLNGDLANDIRKKSIRIQNEIHEERKRKLESIQEMNILREQTPREQLDVKVKELDQLTDRMRKARADREKLSDEMDNLRGKLRYKSLDLRYDQQQRSGKKVTDDGLPQPEITFSNQQRQMFHLNTQFNQKKSLLKDLEERIRQRLSEIQDLESVGLSKQEIQQVIEERNELYEILRQSEENGKNRYELEKKLTEVTEDFSLEHKRSREKITKLEEELDNSFKKTGELYEDRDRLSKELHFYKETIQKQQDDVNEMYKERNDLRNQIDRYKAEIDSERCRSQEMIEQERRRYESHVATEEAQTRILFADLKNQLSALQVENNSNVERGLAFKSKITQLENECVKLRNDLELQDSEFRERSEKIVDEKNQTIEMIRKEFYSKKENEIQTLKIEFDSEQMKTINNLKECYKQQNSDLQIRLENKSQEAQDLKSDIRRMKQDSSEKENNLKGHYETEILRLKEEIKRNADIFQTQKLTETDDIKARYEGLLKKINKEIEEERGLNERLRISLEKANQDVAEESELAKKYKNEKVSAISKLKETAKAKLQEEYKNLKLFYEKEVEDQLTIVERTMQEKNSQLVAKSRDIKSLQNENMERNHASRNVLNYILDAIKYQCSQMANEGKFVSPSFKGIKIHDDVDGQDVVQQILKNFQICCQEYSQYCHECLEKITEDREVSVKMMEEKSSRDLLAIKDQIIKDHADELNTLNLHHKQELNAFQRTHHEEIERLRRNVKDWKQKTADRLAQKLQKEFHKELERKSIKRDPNASSSLSLHSFKNETHQNALKPIGLIEDLRANIRQLREDNISLRKVIIGQNVPYEEQRDTNYNDHCGTNGFVSTRPQSVGVDSFRHRHNSTDATMTRSGSYKLSKQ